MAEAEASGVMLASLHAETPLLVLTAVLAELGALRQCPSAWAVSPSLLGTG